MNGDKKVVKKALISIVDDDASVRESTQFLIRSVGFRAEVFSSAGDFLNSDQIEETGCLILDVRMPGMDGLELQQQLAKEKRPIPIIFITAHADDNEEKRARKAGAVEFLRKPVDEEKLLKAIQAALRQKEAK
jgi:FixJ family two-component response regulator